MKEEKHGYLISVSKLPLLPKYNYFKEDPTDVNFGSEKKDRAELSMAGRIKSAETDEFFTPFGKSYVAIKGKKDDFESLIEELLKYVVDKIEDYDLFITRNGLEESYKKFLNSRQ